MALSPDRLSAALRSIADRIANSSSPSRSAVSAELRRVLANLTGSAPGNPDSAVSQWKTSILQFLSDGEEVSHDSIHEGAEDDSDLEAAEKALDELKSAGKIRENNGVFYAL